MSLIQRSEIHLSQKPRDFKVMTWNLLADQLAKGFPRVSPQSLLWDNRKDLISSEIQSIDSDILLVQELDHYSDFLDPLMASRGFSSIYKKKGEWHNDGIGIFYRNSMFQLLDRYEVQFPGNQFVIGVKLENQGKVIYVFTTHLKAKKQFDSVRVQQVECLFNFFAGLDNHPLIIGGDFNSSPDSEAYRKLKENLIGLRSYYNFGEELEYTTIKYRNSLEVKTEDYIWGRGFELVGYYEIIRKEDIGENGLPSDRYPSDHISLAVNLSFL